MCWEAVPETNHKATLTVKLYLHKSYLVQSYLYRYGTTKFMTTASNPKSCLSVQVASCLLNAQLILSILWRFSIYMCLGDLCFRTRIQIQTHTSEYYSVQEFLLCRNCTILEQSPSRNCESVTTFKSAVRFLARTFRNVLSVRVGKLIIRLWCSQRSQKVVSGGSRWDRSWKTPVTTAAGARATPTAAAGAGAVETPRWNTNQQPTRALFCLKLDISCCCASYSCGNNCNVVVKLVQEYHCFWYILLPFCGNS